MNDMSSESMEVLIGTLVGKVDQHVDTTTAFMQEIRSSMDAIRGEKKSDHQAIYERISSTDKKHNHELGEIYRRLGHIEKVLENNRGYKRGILTALSIVSGIGGGGIVLVAQEIIRLF